MVSTLVLSTVGLYTSDNTPPATVYQTLDVRPADVPRQSLRARSKWDRLPGAPGATVARACSTCADRRSRRPEDSAAAAGVTIANGVTSRTAATNADLMRAFEHRPHPCATKTSTIGTTCRLPPPPKPG